MTDDELKHYGVKGMRWGVRKSRGSRGPKKTTYQKKAPTLSDAELSRRIKRMELEKKYNDLNRSEMSRGARKADEIVERTGTRLASRALEGAALAVAATLAANSGRIAEAAGRTVRRVASSGRTFEF